MTNRKKGTITIELKSDICLGSGYSYAGIVDSDVCYDDCGIPYIPAKRIKGCIRETIETLLYQKYEGKSEDLCGKRGDQIPGDMILGNAYIQDYDKIHQFIVNRKKDKTVKQLYESQGILDRFSHVIGQTGMRDGVAEANTLRYTRVVNQNSPFSGEDVLVFQAEVSCSAENTKLLKDAVRGTKHIGLKRNRGLGRVKCDVDFGKELPPKDDQPDSNPKPTKGMIKEKSANGKTVLSYSLQNNAPMMLSSKNEMVSETFISGRSVLGALAGRYLSIENHSAEDEAFKDLFLRGKVIFTNLYITDGDYQYHPVPDYINKLKKSDCIVNILKKDTDEQDENYSVQKGNQPKKIKNEYMCFDKGFIRFNKVEREVVYHHSHRQKSDDGRMGLLYSMNVIKAGQIFSGQIILPDSYAEEIKGLLGMGDFFFGKSKSSEYGRCGLVEHKPKVQDNSLLREDYKAGDIVAVTFLSDTALVTKCDTGYRYVTDYCGIVKVVRKELGIPRSRCKLRQRKLKIVKAVRKELGILVKAVRKELGIQGENAEYCLQPSIRSTVISGYMSVCNLQRETIPAIASGSYVILDIPEDTTISKLMIGEFTSEGFGQIQIEKVSEMKYRIATQKQESGEVEITDQKDNDNDREDQQEMGEVPEKMIDLMAPVLLEEWLNIEINKMLTNSELKSIDASNSSVGRFVLMLRESMEENSDDPEKIMEEFSNRIKSIKRDAVRKQGEKLIKIVKNLFPELDKKDGEEQAENRCTLDEEQGEEQGEEQDEKRCALDELKWLLEKRNPGQADQELSKKKKKLWPDYLMAILVNRKYEGREE